MSYEDHEIVLPPRPPKIAYLIDPLMARSRTMQDIGEPCRVDGEIDGGEVWKWTAKHRIARILGPLAVLALLVALVPTSRSADASPAPAHTTVACPTLQIGDTGQAVTELQYRFRGYGWTIAVDGIFGPQTDRIVRKFQEFSGLEVDGIAGPITQGALGCGATPAVPATPADPKNDTPATPATRAVPTYNGGGSGADRWHDLAIQVGWSEGQWPTVRCIISRESNGRPEVQNSIGATGLMQILQSHRPGMNLKDPANNLRVGLELYRASGWTPWYHPTKRCY